jgi:heat shock protein HslJ
MRPPALARDLVALAAASVIIVGTAGCMPSSDAIADRPWGLAEINGSAPAVPAHIEFGVDGFGTDGTYTVQPGCNTGGGTYRIVGNTIDFGQASITAMACGEPADSQEQAFMAVLGDRPRFEIETQTGRLRLAADSGSLIFVTP